jgi:phosphonoacetaldehyde hydrolase
MDAVKLVVFDWAGTTIDHGSMAPLAAFARTFALHGVPVTPAQARAPMGLHKADHLRTLLRLPPVADLWRQVHGRDWNEEDVACLYRTFTAVQLEVIDAHARLVPHVHEAVAALRRAGMKITATTGYFRAAAERVVAAGRAQGFAPDFCICAEDVPAGRPAPWMLFRCMEALGVYPPSAVVKVGDTVPDVGEGRNAGAWAIGVLQTGNEVGCTEEQWQSLAPDERALRLEAARKTLLGAGAHATIETLAELPALIEDISARLRRGVYP